METTDCISHQKCVAGVQHDNEQVGLTFLSSTFVSRAKTTNINKLQNAMVWKRFLEN